MARENSRLETVPLASSSHARKTSMTRASTPGAASPFMICSRIGTDDSVSTLTATRDASGSSSVRSA